LLNFPIYFSVTRLKRRLDIKISRISFCHRMKTQFILIACLTIAGRALKINTQVHETPSDSQQWQPWKNQDLNQAASVEQEQFHPVTFEDSDTQKDSQQPLIYNANIQSGASGVAEVLNQQSVRIIDIIRYFRLKLNLDKIKLYV